MDEDLKKRYKEYEIVYILSLTIIVALTWILSLDTIEGMIQSYVVISKNMYLLCSLIISSIIATVTMKLLRKIMIRVIDHELKKEKKMKEETK